MLSVAYLAYEVKMSLSKLSNQRSYIMIAYYGCLWLVSLLNLVWCCLQKRAIYCEVKKTLITVHEFIQDEEQAEATQETTPRENQY
ncbi:unnamed protein product [Brassica napus]|uniref:(rape) hypothetical protein n=1 Tax=Brassica napus TaxID=3708 RepID=A0A816Q8I3_BRANA|nr:unnamed protein product [Brassica napus]